MPNYSSTQHPAPRTASEAILSDKAGYPVHAGDVIVCKVDWLLGTDAATPMAIDYFRQMGGRGIFDSSRVLLALDHYSPPSTPGTQAFHDQIRAFAAEHGCEVCQVGDGISHQILVESGKLRPGDLVAGADSHTVTCGALGVFATGIGSSDLAAAFMTGQVWLRVPAAIKVTLTGKAPAGVAAKDVALALVALVGPDGANYRALEFHGPAADAMSLDDRLVLCNLAVEMDAKAAIFPEKPAECGGYEREVALDLSSLSPQIALPHAPHNVKALDSAVGTPVQMVFIGTCTGGRVSDIHEAVAVIERAGGKIARGVQLVVTPASRAVAESLESDGTMGKLLAMGATVTTAGCGACCGTSGVIPAAGSNVMSTANRNFKGRMGQATAEIYLASPAACAAAAVAGRIVAVGAGT